MKSEQNAIWCFIVAPLRMLKVERVYYIWLACIFTSFIGIEVDLCNGNISESFKQGAFYSTSCTLIAPFIIEFLIDYRYINRSEGKERFTAHKSFMYAISFVLYALSFLCYATKLKTYAPTQILIAVIVSLLAFYMFLISKMGNHPNIFKDYEDINYIDAENELIRKMKIDAKKLESTDDEGKKIQL